MSKHALNQLTTVDQQSKSEQVYALIDESAIHV